MFLLIAAGRGPLLRPATPGASAGRAPSTSPLRLDIALRCPLARSPPSPSSPSPRRDPDARVLLLDAVAFELESVTLAAGDVPLPFAYDGEVLQVTLGALSSGVVRVRYRARPRRGLYFLAPDADAPTRPEQVWSQCQDEDARYWFPCTTRPTCA
ncbi:MAG: hypothetical protein IPF99_27040 [Deltaproteobacteria bacterium]|nr:hypothetical protein [Deltaproteobacteria bacterium]